MRIIDIAEGSIAAASMELHGGDVVLNVNGKSVDHVAHAAQHLGEASGKLVLLIVPPGLVGVALISAFSPYPFIRTALWAVRQTSPM